MTSSLLELTAEIVSSHASVTEMSSEDLLQELHQVHDALQKLDEESEEAGESGAAKGPAVSMKRAFQPDQISCMLCGKSGMKTLARHLAQVHGLKPRQYRKQFGIPSSQALTASNFSDARRTMAKEKGLANNLAKARAVRAAKLAARGGEAKMVKAPRMPKQKRANG